MNKRAKLARELRALAAFIEQGKDSNDDAEAGIRLAEISRDWAESNFGFSDPLRACREVANNTLAMSS